MGGLVETMSHHDNNRESNNILIYRDDNNNGDYGNNNGASHDLHGVTQWEPGNWTTMTDKITGLLALLCGNRETAATRRLTTCRWSQKNRVNHEGESMLRRRVCEIFWGPADRFYSIFYVRLVWKPARQPIWNILIKMTFRTDKSRFRS